MARAVAALALLGCCGAACFPSLTFRDAPDAAADAQATRDDDAAVAAPDAHAPEASPSDAHSEPDVAPGTAADASTFPASTNATPLDRFDRADAPLGSPWIAVDAFFVEGNELVAHPVSGSSYAFWGATFGVRQEAYVTFRSPPSSHQARLLLHSDGLGNCISAAVYLAIVWGGSTGQVSVEVCTTVDGGTYAMEPLGSATVPFAQGDRMGARVLEDGSVTVFRNATPVLAATLPDAPIRRVGGNIGVHSYTDGTRFDDFGGGTVP